MADNPNFCDYTVKVVFNQLQGLNCGCSLPYLGTVRHGGSLLFTLKRSSPNAQTAFQYSVTSFRGRALRNPPADFPYLLPVANGRKVLISESKYIGELLKDERKEGFYALVVKTEPGDTIFAARRGVIAQVRNDVDPVGKDLWYARDANFVEIYHADGTFARYDKLKRGQIWVEEGSFVEVGQPIGLVGGENLSGGPALFFSVYFLPEENLREISAISYQHVKPSFCTGANPAGEALQHGQTYEAVRPEAVLVKEMSRREQKRRQPKSK